MLKPQACELETRQEMGVLKGGDGMEVVDNYYTHCFGLAV